MKTDFDWSDLAFASKKPLRELNAIFIAAPREISVKRFTQLVKEYLPQGAIILGIAKESYVEGFEQQPQFRMLDQKTVQPVLDKVAVSSSSRRIYTLRYFQRELPFIIEKLQPKKMVFVNGSWKFSFHTQPTYYTLVNSGVPYEKVSPFADDTEAEQTAKRLTDEIISSYTIGQVTNANGMLKVADAAARRSFDHTYQTGAALGKKQKNGYALLATSCNKVVPYQTYAWHIGPSREVHFSPPNDLNYYDAVHAEVEMIIEAGRQNIGLDGTSLFINLLPCPTCARMLAETNIPEIIYREDHSSGYAVKMLELAGKTVRRIV